MAAATVRGEIIGHQIITSSGGGVLGYRDLGNGQTEVRFTLPGDAALDGTVDVGDLGALATAYGATAGGAWSQGDFNYDGKVDVGDLGALASHYGQSLGANSGNSSAADPMAITAAAVPEPTSLAMLAMTATSLTLRRWRRHGR
ncbi:MAG TPA: PEP-CTERM sorting domain-containing protein [Tepidisphaeraceae bacterium]|nr:PEP-CTERM sorting domain-containing protein [Tepidisphaeraceae bacterium]